MASKLKSSCQLTFALWLFYGCSDLTTVLPDAALAVFPRRALVDDWINDRNRSALPEGDSSSYPVELTLGILVSTDPAPVPHW